MTDIPKAYKALEASSLVDPPDRKSPHRVYFHAGTFSFWKGHTATTYQKYDWTKIVVEGHGQYPNIEITGGTQSEMIGRARDFARLLDMAFKEGRKYQAEVIRKAIHWDGSV